MTKKIDLPVKFWKPIYTFCSDHGKKHADKCLKVFLGDRFLSREYKVLKVQFDKIRGHYNIMFDCNVFSDYYMQIPFTYAWANIFRGIDIAMSYKEKK